MVVFPSMVVTVKAYSFYCLQRGVGATEHPGNKLFHRRPDAPLPFNVYATPLNTSQHHRLFCGKLLVLAPQNNVLRIDGAVDGKDTVHVVDLVLQQLGE